MLPEQAVLTALKVSNALYETVKEAGPQGAPAGPMFAACTHYGMSLETFQFLMNCQVKAGRVRLSNNVYYVVNNG